ncbi:dna polymerase iii subunit delta [Leptolyngbya sp. Heron Island J]|uniref:DNA polymerase III subunit delta' n=1 Tax=Leptolyngbya sp. Heron Island J TaxID=1385935 RepID=UPI0003B94774|nr:DNA polymerase III subunit delta' [Leptolyngbya sp. Heron Island J]ESA34232.1 dna polymerase iii subunit delta [Leptolyngbya sp. Heron Island J]
MPSKLFSAPVQQSFNQHFNHIVGQSQAVELLVQAIIRQRIAPGYLFIGPAGIGRSLVATAFTTILLHSPDGSSDNLKRRIQARNHPDLLWVEPTYLHQGKLLTVSEAQTAGLKRRGLPQVRLEQIRDIARFLSRPPLEAERSVVVIESAELIAEAAANGLLKTLEEPGQATLVLIAPDQQTLLPTLISRCQTIPFRRLGPSDMAQVLTTTDHIEILDYPEVLSLAQGSPGAAIASWQQLQTIPPDLLQQVSQPIRNIRTALELARQIVQTLEPESQLWLLDYLQQNRWQQGHAHGMEKLELARKQLLRYVQPRLVWEVTLMNLI